MFLNENMELFDDQLAFAVSKPFYLYKNSYALGNAL
jgi:hypothetical protein